MPCGHHVQFRINIEEDIEIERSYTPVFKDLGLNPFDSNFDSNLHFLIKTYTIGLLTPHLEDLPIGGKMDISNPIGSFNANIFKKSDFILLLAAGTGITPMCKVIQFINDYCTKNKSKKRILLLNFNKTKDDIIWRNQLENLKKSEEFQFEIENILSQDEQWNGYKGRISADLLTKMLPKLSENEQKLACFCGPIPFTRTGYQLLQDSFSFKKEEVWKFEG